jgi:shikimate kinase
MRPIFLIGYMGSGKTTLGEALATEMGLQFIDLDEFIEEKCESRVSDIFKKVGEKKFRELEHGALLETAGGSDVVIACGGGTPCFDKNMELMNSSGLTIWLTTSPERLAARLCLPEQKAKRPLMTRLRDDEILAEVKKGLAQREQYYSKAQLHFDSTDIETAEATIATARKLKKILENTGL